MTPPSIPYYPWYAAIGGDDIQQGDILDACPVFFPRGVEIDTPQEPSHFDWAKRDVIVLSQSCDLVKGREKVTDVLLCSCGGVLNLPVGALQHRKAWKMSAAAICQRSTCWLNAPYLSSNEN